MAHPPEKRMELRAAYIGGLPLEAAASKAGVPYATARNWFNLAKREGDDWDKFRAASLIVAGGGIEQALGRIIAAGLMRCETLLEQDFKDPLESVKAMGTLGDTIAKLDKASARMMPEADRQAQAQDGLKRLAAFALERTPQHLAALAEILAGFAAREKLQIAAAVEELITVAGRQPQAGDAPGSKRDPAALKQAIDDAYGLS